MSKRCLRACDQKNRVKGESNGWRVGFYYPGGGKYTGYFRDSKPHQYGVKADSRKLIYDGQWASGQRHGHGTMRRTLADGSAESVHVGEWRNDMKCGEGKHFYDNGIYYGMWQNNRRHGLGIKWYNDNRIYLGEWQSDVKHGLGVLFCANGNRYEGSFARGFKNGQGTFYHMQTGQVQKGMWENDVCKTSIVQDEFRHQVIRPTEYPIPQCALANPDEYVYCMFKLYMSDVKKCKKSVMELQALNFVKKMRRYAKFEPKMQSNTKFPLEDRAVPCTCRKQEQPVFLRHK